jgi:5-(carboxyamino)imidazole ribonucleotide synthase
MGTEPFNSFLVNRDNLSMKVIHPGSTIGVFGSGQLGRMFAIEARKMGYRVHTFSPDTDTPTGQVADVETSGDYVDLEKVETFAKSVDVVTFEFENVPSSTIETAGKFCEVHPNGSVLHTTQNRLREKQFLSSNGYPVAPFRHVRSIEELRDAVSELGCPSILKTAGFGYDGKGQSKINSPSDAEEALAGIGDSEAVLEGFIDFEKEVSVVCARSNKGEFVHYGVIENSHLHHILDVSFVPAAVSERCYSEATEIARTLAEQFNYVGTLCIEFFVTSDEDLIINEIAPRPHNSGHLTFGPAITSQFEQQVRATCGLPLGSTEFTSPAVAMANLLGDVWASGEPLWTEALFDQRIKLHLYGKTNPRPKRKMGHITAAGNDVKEVVELVRNARKRLIATA